VKNIRSKNKR